MTPDVDVALGHLKRVLTRDPMLRDVIASVLPGLSDGPGFVPSVDVVELDDRHVVLLDVPGVPKDGVKVRLEGARLVVTGERPVVTLEGGTTRTAERAYGAFKREFLLPPDVDADAVKATIEDGVLRVDVPRKGGGRRDVPVGG